MDHAFRKHLSDLMDHLCNSGLAVLKGMEKAGQITRDEKRSLQYRFVRGARDAQIAMSDPKAAVKLSKEQQAEACAKSELEQGLRRAVEEWLECMLGPQWRTVHLRVVTLPSDIGAQSRRHGEKVRDALLRKPSDVPKPKWALPAPATFKKLCEHCGESDHTSEQCPTLPLEEVSPDGNAGTDQQG